MENYVLVVLFDLIIFSLEIIEVVVEWEQVSERLFTFKFFGSGNDLTFFKLFLLLNIINFGFDT